MLLSQDPNYPIVKGDKVILKQIALSDLDDIMEICYYDGFLPSTQIETIETLEKIYKDYLNGEGIHWGIYDSQSMQIVGTCGYYRGFKNNAGELGCILLPDYYGKGYMTQALQQAIDYGKSNLKLKRIFAITNQDNKKAIELLHRLNFIEIQNLDDNCVEFDLK